MNIVKPSSSFSRKHLLLFALLFGAVGGYIIYRSFAAPNPNLPGDLNADNIVNISDLSILLSNYGTTNPTADINLDGTVNILDLSILLSHWGQSTTASTLKIGETNVLSTADSGNSNLLLAQSAVLSQTATLQSLSFYVTTASGTLRLGLYDSSGPSGGPGAKIAETAEITPIVGWNTANVTTPISLAAGTYWLAYLPSSSTLAFVQGTNTSSNSRYYSYTYAPMPGAFSTTPSTTAAHWSFYATLLTSGTNPPPPPPNGCTEPTLYTDRLYSCASAWNTPIPTNPPIHPDSVAMTANTPWVINKYSGYPWLGGSSRGNRFGLSIQNAPSTTPLTTVVIDYPSCAVRTIQVPIPSGTEVDQLTVNNENLFALLVSNGDEWNFYDITPPNAPTKNYGGTQCPTSNAWHSLNAVQHSGSDGWKGSSTETWSPRESHIAVAAGVIRPRDTLLGKDATWDHAVAIRSWYNCAAGQVHPVAVLPANMGAGSATGTQCLPLGARLQLDPSISCSTWASIQAINMQWMQALCRTAQKYGVIPTDAGATMDYTGWNLNGYNYPWNGCSDSAHDCGLPADLMSHFRVIDWTKWTGQ